MYHSLQHLAALPDDTILYPGHRYSVASHGTTRRRAGEQLRLQARTKEQWLTMFGH